jgi:hypothetical protein
MARGPHDNEIEETDPEEDHARKRLEEFLKQRGPNPPSPESQEEQERPEEPQDPGRKPPCNP